MNINRKEFINILAEQLLEVNPNHTLSKKDIEICYEAFLKTLTDSLTKEDRIFFSGFGAFSVKKRAATVKTSPQDPSIRFQIPAKKVVKFKPSDKLTDMLN